MADREPDTQLGLVDVRRRRRRPHGRAAGGPDRRACACSLRLNSASPGTGSDRGRGSTRANGHWRRRRWHRYRCQEAATAADQAATNNWAGSVEASPPLRAVAEAAGAAVDHAVRIRVDPNCTVRRRPAAFVIGDLMRLDRLPGIAQVAIHSGRHAAERIIRRRRDDCTERPFRYRDRGPMAPILHLQAIASVGPVSTSGVARWAAVAGPPPVRAPSPVSGPRRRTVELDHCVLEPRAPATRHYCLAGVRPPGS